MRLIDADKLPLDIEREDIDDAPTIDAVEVVHGKWEERYIEDANPLFRRRFYCSRCGNWTTYGKTLYCPNCGAKMDGEVKKDDDCRN